MTKNPYDVLGVPETATEDEIKSAYRKKAKENHPDLHPDDPGASDRMNEINEAYSILQDPEKLRMWKLQQSGSYSASGGQTYWDPFTGQQTQNPFGGQWQNGQQGNGGYSNFGGWTVYDFSDIFDDAQEESQQQYGGNRTGRQYEQWRPRTYNLSLGCLPALLIFWFITMFLFRTGIFFFILPLGLLWNLFRRK